MTSRFDKPTYCADPNCDRGCNEAQMIYQCALRISQAADTIGRIAHPVSKPKKEFVRMQYGTDQVSWFREDSGITHNGYPAKPKGKKKTFYRGEKASDGNYITKTSSTLGSPIELFQRAYEYALANPGSILEIVVRKPVK